MLLIGDVSVQSAASALPATFDVQPVGQFATVFARHGLGQPLAGAGPLLPPTPR